jgi:diguanylate cyclase (GGDEF)-like protein/PAS domain S-box-containing protein
MRRRRVVALPQMRSRVAHGRAIALSSNGDGRLVAKGARVGEQQPDTDELVRLTHALREQSRRLAELESLAELGSWIWDVDADVVSLSAEMYRLLDRHPTEVESSFEAYLNCLHQNDRVAARSNVGRALAERRPFDADYRVACADGTIRWLHCRGRVVADDDGTGTGVGVRFIGTAQDVTDRKRLEEELVHKALHDALTGLPARTLLEDRLEHALRRIQHDDRVTAVFFVDIDQFKAVNDQAGHHRGDQALQVLAARLQDAVRPADTVARFAGDEFVVIAEDLEWPDEALAIAGRIHDAASFTIATEATELTVTSSIGATVVESASEVSDVLRESDIAMYNAKHVERGTVSWFGDLTGEVVPGPTGSAFD